MQIDMSLDELARQINRMSRIQCIYELTHFPQMRLDFDERFLMNQSLDRLHHLLFAACVTVKRRVAA